MSAANVCKQVNEFLVSVPGGLRGCLWEVSRKVEVEMLTFDSPANQRIISFCGSGLTREVDYSIY